MLVDNPARLVARVLINAAALWIAAHLVHGVSVQADFGSILIVAAIFGIVNAVIKPIFRLLTCPIQLLTLGLFTLVINAAMLVLTAWIAGQLGVDFHVDGFAAAFLGAIVVSIISWILSALL